MIAVAPAAKRELRYVHELPGVRGAGTSGDPFVNWESQIAAAADGTTFNFIDGYFTSAAGFTVANSNVHLRGTGATVLRSTEAAFPVVAVSGITRAGAVATATRNAHGYVNGDQVLIAGAAQAEYNVFATVYGVTANTFNFTVKGTPATPATGTITAQKGRVMIRCQKSMTDPTIANRILWRGSVEGLILDGGGAVEMAMYWNVAYGCRVSHCEFVNFTRYLGKFSNAVNCRLDDCHCVLPASIRVTSVPPRFWLFGENDPAGAAGVGGAFNTTIADCYFDGGAENILEFVYGTQNTLLNGNCGYSASALILGNETSQFRADGTDFESGGTLLIDGSRHWFHGVNLNGVTIHVTGVGQVVSGSGNGNHLFDNLYTLLALVYDATEQSIVTNLPSLVATGTHPENVVHVEQGATLQVVKGASFRSQRSTTGAVSGFTTTLDGYRVAHALTGPNGFYIVDDAAGSVDRTSEAAVGAAAAVKVVGKNAYDNDGNKIAGNASGTATLPGTYTLTTAMAATGLSVNLPKAGTYLITASVRVGVNGNYAQVQLHDDTANAYVNSPTLAHFDHTNTDVQTTVPIAQIVTVAAATTISLHAKCSAVTGTNYIYQDAAGETRLSFVRLA